MFLIKEVWKFAPLDDEWHKFWFKLDEIGVWDWEKEYKDTSGNTCLPFIEIEIKYKTKKVLSRWDGSGQDTAQEFYKALYELTGLYINHLDGVQHP